LLATALLGLALGAAAVSLNPLHSAPAPEPRPQWWEYKVVPLSNVRRDVDPAEILTEQFNALAKDGWEYAGQVAARGVGGEGPGSQYVAFRRFKP
jgi:hypothetical protein